MTSPERLNLAEEWLFPLQGLDFPEEPAQTKLQTYSAFDLFIQRAKQINPRFEPDSESGALGRICYLVDGMPLGLELAAGWVGQLSCQEIVAEITRELDFLSTNLRNIPDRHRNMRAVLASSWQYLSAKEQEILQKLSIFRGGFERFAAAEIAEASLIDLSALVNKSLSREGRSGRLV